MGTGGPLAGAGRVQPPECCGTPTPEEENFWEGAAFSLDVAARELTALISMEIQGEDANETRPSN